MTSLFLLEGFLMASSAELFGLYKFCSADVVDGNGELLGSLETYGSVPRSPFLSDAPLIERAACLAAVAITRHNQAEGETRLRLRWNEP